MLMLVLGDPFMEGGFARRTLPGGIYQTHYGYVADPFSLALSHPRAVDPTGSCHHVI